MNQGLESRYSVGDQSRLVSLLSCNTITDVLLNLFVFFYQTLAQIGIVIFILNFAFAECCN